MATRQATQDEIISTVRNSHSRLRAKFLGSLDLQQQTRSKLAWRTDKDHGHGCANNHIFAATAAVRESSLAA